MLPRPPPPRPPRPADGDCPPGGGGGGGAPRCPGGCPARCAWRSGGSSNDANSATTMEREGLVITFLPERGRLRLAPGVVSHAKRFHRIEVLAFFDPLRMIRR